MPSSPNPARPTTRLHATALEDRSLPASFFPTLYTTESVDLSTVYTGNSFDVSYTNLDNFFADSSLPSSAFYLPQSARTSVPSGGNFSFIDAGSSGQAYILPQVRNDSLPFLGISTIGSFPGTLTPYRPVDARVTTSEPWIRLDVSDVRGPGNFSLYQTSVTGLPTNWVASGDGITTQDRVYIASGERGQYSWAFTEPGIYEIDFTATGFRGANQTLPLTSETQTLFFSVDTPGPTNSVPVGAPASSGGNPIIFTSGGNSLSIAGPTTSPAPLQTTISVQNGTLALGATTGVGVVSGNTTGRVSVIGTVDQINVALNGVVYTPTPGFNGVDNFTITTNDRGEYRPATLPEQTDSDSFGVLVSGNPIGGPVDPTVPPVVPPPPPGTPQALPRWAALGSAGEVVVVDTETRETVSRFTPYEAAFEGEINVAVADLRRTGTPEIITVPANAGGVRVQVFAQPGGPARLNFFAFDSKFQGGATVASADVNGDGFPDIVVGAGPGGGPRVSVFDGLDGRQLRTFFAFESSFTGGVSVAAGDVNGDGVTDIVVGAGPGGGPAVAVFDGANPANVQRFFAFDPAFTGGVNIAVGNVRGDGAAEIVLGAGQGGGPLVRVYDGVSLAPFANFLATPMTAETTSGVKVSVSDLNRDLTSDVLTAVSTSPTAPVQLLAFDLTQNSFRPRGTDLGLTDEFLGGVDVAGLSLV